MRGQTWGKLLVGLGAEGTQLVLYGSIAGWAGLSRDNAVACADGFAQTGSGTTAERSDLT